MIFTKQRIKILFCLAVAVLLGFWMWRYYRGWAEYWIRFYVSGAVYVIIWSLAFFFLWPNKTNIVRIPIVIFILTCVLEFLQLWKAEFLERIRATLAGAALIGTDFVWQQIPYYVLGTVISIFLLAILANKK